MWFFRLRALCTALISGNYKQAGAIFKRMDDRSNQFKLVKYTVYLWQSKNDNIYTSGNYELK